MSAPAHLPSLDDGSLHWTKKTSKNGKSFEIGVAKAAMEARSNLTSGAIKPAGGKKEDFTINVDWPVVEYKDRTTIWLSSDVQDVAALKWYSLYKDCDASATWKNILYFENTLHYDYKFEDESKDNYECNTWENGTHYVRYNSDQPTIKKVHGN